MLRSSLLLFLVCCGGKTIEPLDDGGSNDGSPKKDVIVLDAKPPPPPPDDGGPQCNNIDPGTKTVSLVAVPQNPPPFASSDNIIQPGLYELVAFTTYTGPNGTSGNEGSITAQVRVNVANSAEYIFQAAAATGNEGASRSNANGNSGGPGVLVIAQTCPTVDQGTKVLYAADSSSLVLRVGSGNNTADETYAYIGP